MSLKTQDQSEAAVHREQMRVEARRRDAAVAARKSGPPRRGKTLACAHCGAEFYAGPTDVSRGRRYCSRRCAGLAKVRTQTCKVCGEEFSPASPPRETCSRACRSEAARKALAARFTPDMARRSRQTRRRQRAALDADVPGTKRTVCERPGCGNPLVGQASIYCSPSCHYADRRRRRGLARAVHACAMCGALFTWNGRGKGVFCSLPCARRAGKNHGRRPEVVVPARPRAHHRRADFRDAATGCRGCGAPAVHHHHVVFRQHIERAGGDRWHPDDALALCLRCHADAHMLRLPLCCLRDENFRFARELFGAGKAYEYLRRRYAGADPRLDALDREYATGERAA